MTIDEALYEMELIGHDFFLFVNKKPVVHPSSTTVTVGATASSKSTLRRMWPRSNG